MKPSTSTDLVREIMAEFARLTGLSPIGKAPRRYLWTDAFAVCNFLGLYQQTQEEHYQQLALDLVAQVHHVLGRYRENDPRTGWISGLDEQEGKLHPTIGGLRIGKSLNERQPYEPFDEQLEWDRDGQYYHYLTKWMHALNRVSRVTKDPTYNTWAMELAKTAHVRFTYIPSSGGQKRMYWKKSIDFSRPLVPSMGHHDPLDGFITYHQLQATATKDFAHAAWPDLTAEIADMATICEGKNWTTDDSLGLGGLLCETYRVAQLISHRSVDLSDLLENLLEASLVGLEFFGRQNLLRLPADYRLAFRELGLSIGFRAVERLQTLIEAHPDLFKTTLTPQIEVLKRYAPLRDIIETFWLDATHQETFTWVEHREINMVMLATSLAPEGYLNL